MRSRDWTMLCLHLPGRANVHTGLTLRLTLSNECFEGHDQAMNLFLGLQLSVGLDVAIK